MYVASRYHETAAVAKMREAFHKAVAKRVGDRRTEEVFTEEEYDAMYRSIVGKAA
jgi:hypothetical protein